MPDRAGHNKIEDMWKRRAAIDKSARKVPEVPLSWPLEAALMARRADSLPAADLAPPADRPYRDMVGLIWLQVGAAANAVLGDYGRTAALVLEHARLFAKLLADPRFDELTDAKMDDFHVICALTFGVDSAIVRGARSLADALFDRWIGPQYPFFDESAILLDAWQKLMLFRGDGAGMARECLDPENDSWAGFASRSFPAFIALAQGSSRSVSLLRTSAGSRRAWPRDWRSTSRARRRRSRRGDTERRGCLP